MTPPLGLGRPPRSSIGHGGNHATLLRDGKVLLDRRPAAPAVRPRQRNLDRNWEDGSGRSTYNTFTVLRDGRVLAVSGADSPQLYDPASGNWTTTGKMNIPRLYGALATLLSDGKVLVAGGFVHGELDRRASPAYERSRGLRPRHGVLDRDRGHAGAARDRDGDAAARWQGAGVLDDSDRRSTTRPPEPGPHVLCRPSSCQIPGTAVGWHRAGGGHRRPGCLYRRVVVRPADRVVDDHIEHAPVRRRSPRSRSCSTARFSRQGHLLQRRAPVPFEWRGRVVCPCRRVAAAVAFLPAPDPAGLPESDPRPDAAPARGRSRSAERSELDRHG